MSETSPTLGRNYLEAIISDFHRIKRQGEKSMAQLSGDDFHWAPDAESNNIAILVKHISGNMVSRWMDFLTTDGEKESRKRDTEFVDDIASPEDLMEIWKKGWDCVFAALESLSPDELTRTITIRGQDHTIVEAISRALWHYGFHVGQILYIAKQIKGSEWKNLSIPKGKSEEFFRVPRR